MKQIKYLSFILLISFTVFGCIKNYIDPISAVGAGPDETAPQVKITYPLEGTKIQVLEDVVPITIKFEVTDDIEITEVSVSLDGTSLTSITEFKDYRRLIDEYTYDNLTSGDHTVTITAKDKEGKTTTETVNFQKVSPYTPVYAGELLYMPFNGDFIDLINLKAATTIGNPGFAGESIMTGDGQNAYKGELDSYITLPGDAYHADEFSAVFWLKPSNIPDRAGILAMSAPDLANPDKPNNRKNGFRVLREAAGAMQRYKVNIGTGATDVWLDGGTAADVNPTENKWRHFAFTVSKTKAVFYIDGQVIKESPVTGIDWTGCDLLSIMSGAPRFTEWSHLSGKDLMDELRFFNRELSQAQIQSIITRESGRSATGYEPKYDGEEFYMPFDDKFMDMVTGATAAVVGQPTFANNGIDGKSYKGAADSYLSFPIDNLKSNEISLSFWIKIDPTQDRAGVIAISAPDEANPAAPNNRNSGLRILHEKAGTMQRFKLNVGTGTADVWVDGGTAADVDPAAGNWVHVAAVISSGEAILYLNGTEVKRSNISGISWTGCDKMSIMSGAPLFTGWDHYSDKGTMDEFRIFNKALSPAEITQIINDVL